ncbi:MAG: hypothetical protein KME30_29995 [Iphinoe sp. HA4291-MV1]|jgi:hypothetical protein|nr:hypothetical protein [Iphinoe sp. HA4291-MV1]
MFNRPCNLDSVSNDYWVFRLARLPKDFSEKGKVLAIQLDGEFELSTQDKQSNPPHLSVWVDSLTTHEQAYNFLTENTPNSQRKLVLRLFVQEIREIVGCSGEGRTYNNILNVIWVFLYKYTDKQCIRDKRPGANGHSGITGLDEKSAPKELTTKQAKLLRKDLRSKLAEIASKNTSILKSGENV